MKIETKYDIGQRIWIVYEHQGEIHVYEDKIIEICIAEKGTVYLPNSCTDEVEEEEIILYKDMDKLVSKIKELAEDVKRRQM